MSSSSRSDEQRNILKKDAFTTPDGDLVLLSFPIPKALRPINFKDFLAELGDTKIWVWLNPPKDVRQRQWDLLSEYAKVVNAFKVQPEKKRDEKKHQAWLGRVGAALEGLVRRDVEPGPGSRNALDAGRDRRARGAGPSPGCMADRPNIGPCGQPPKRIDDGRDDFPAMDGDHATASQGGPLGGATRCRLERSAPWIFE